MTVTGNYMAFPYNPSAALKTLLFVSDGKLLYDMTERVDFCTPDRTVYFECSRWKGRDVVIVCEADNIVISDDCTQFKNAHGASLVGQCDSLPEPDGVIRPFIHFTRNRGWLSDPNGPVLFGGWYHVFFQSNPVSAEHRNMHWGHVRSRDLFHWEELPEALIPNEDGEVFSGSAVVTKKQLRLFYTAAGGMTRLSRGASFKVCSANSVDGVTFTPYKKDIIPAGEAEYSRDPKVVWCEELNTYLMLIYRYGSSYALLSSVDLSSWRFEQLIELPADSECPDLYLLYADGNKGKPYWIIAGASDRYLIGRFEQRFNEDESKDSGSDRIVFVPAQRAGRLHFGNASYAGQSFFGTGDGEVKRLTWLTTDLPGADYAGQFSVPMRMSLVTGEDRMYLCAQPVEEIRDLYRRKQRLTDVVIEGAERKVGINGSDGGVNAYTLTVLPHAALDMLISLPPEKKGTITFSFYGITLNVDFYRNTVECAGCTAPLRAGEDSSNIRVIADRLSLELFIDGGKFYMSVETVCDYNLDRLNISADREMTVPGIEVRELDITANDGFWEENSGMPRISEAIAAEHVAVGIDIGSTTLSFDIVDISTGRELRSFSVPNDTHIAGKTYENLYDPDKILQKVISELDNILGDDQLPTPECIGITGQMHGIIYVDGSGRAVSPLYSWMDGTGAQPIKALGGKSASQYLSEITGSQVATGMGIATLLNHMLNNELPDGAAVVCTAGDYIAIRLTGRTRPCMHSSNAASLGAFDIRRCRFQTETLEKAGIDTKLLPEVTDGYTMAGQYRGIPVAVAIGDNQASFLASVSSPDGAVLVNIGTGSQISFVTSSFDPCPGMEVRPLSDGKRIMVGSSLCGGRSLSMLENFLCDTVRFVSGKDCGGAYRSIDRYLNEIFLEKGETAFEHSLSVDTCFCGTREEPWRTGSVTGIVPDNFTPEEIVKGFFFGIADELYQLYLSCGGQKPESLVISGGAVKKSGYLRSVLERSFNCKAAVPAWGEAAAYGSIVYAQVATGIAETPDIPRSKIQYI